MKIKLRDLTLEQCQKWEGTHCREQKSCEGCILKSVACNSFLESSRIKHKDLFSDKFLDQEIEIADEPILTDKEKNYLKVVIEPFRDKVRTIAYYGSEYLDGDNDFIVIELVEDYISFPILEDVFTFKNMKFGKEYTLEELGL